MANENEKQKTETVQPTAPVRTPVPNNTEAAKTPVQAPAATPAVKQVGLELKIKLVNPTKLEFIICNTGERNTRMLHENKFTLTKNVLFKIPLHNTNINYSNIDIIKLNSPYTEYFRILDIVNGIATIEPILHGVTIENDAVIGMVY